VALRFYASRNWHPFFLQGTKLLAYEIWGDLGFTAPGCVIVPAGAGSLVLGCFIGFTELVAFGAIPRIPRILVAQPRNCSPLAEAFARTLRRTDQFDRRRRAPRFHSPATAVAVLTGSGLKAAQTMAAIA
jgi:threonine synthase